MKEVLDAQEKTEKKNLNEIIEEYFNKYKLYLDKIWIKRKFIIWFNSIVCILATLYILILVNPYYDATLVILPDYGTSTSSILGQLGGLASLAGMGDLSPNEIYNKILSSDAVLEKVIYNKYQTLEYEKPVNLIEYYQVEPDDKLPKELHERSKYLYFLKFFGPSFLTSEVDRTTKVLTITARFPESRLAMEVVNKVGIELDLYVRTKRKSYASEQRIYLEKRLNQVSDSLWNSEESLKRFREQNRTIGTSPQLILEQARLTRSIEILQTIFAELTKQLEIVKVEEIKDTPVLNIQEMAKEPVLKTGPNKKMLLAIYMIISVLFSLSIVLFGDLVKEQYFHIKKLVMTIIK